MEGCAADLGRCYLADALFHGADMRGLKGGVESKFLRRFLNRANARAVEGRDVASLRGLLANFVTMLCAAKRCRAMRCMTMRVCGSLQNRIIFEFLEGCFMGGSNEKSVDSSESNARMRAEYKAKHGGEYRVCAPDRSWDND